MHLVAECSNMLRHKNIPDIFRSDLYALRYKIYLGLETRYLHAVFTRACLFYLARNTLIYFPHTLASKKIIHGKHNDRGSPHLLGSRGLSYGDNGNSFTSYLLFLPSLIE